MTLQQSIVLALQASIFMTVFDFGLQATFDDVLYVVRRPSLLVRSLVAMFVIMPVVAVTLAETFTFLESIEAALLALSISPIPPLLPGKEQDAGGETSYGLGLMAIAAGLSIVILPLTLQLFGLYFGRSFAMSSGAIARVVLTSVILPLAAGLALRAIAPRLARRLRKPVGLVASTVLVIGVSDFWPACFQRRSHWWATAPSSPLPSLRRLASSSGTGSGAHATTRGWCSHYQRPAGIRRLRWPWPVPIFRTSRTSARASCCTCW